MLINDHTPCKQRHSYHAWLKKITSTAELAHLATPAEINGVIEDACRIAASNSHGYLSGTDIEEAFFRKTQSHILPDAKLKGLQLCAYDDEEQPLKIPLCHQRTLNYKYDLRLNKKAAIKCGLIFY